MGWVILILVLFVLGPLLGIGALDLFDRRVGLRYRTWARILHRFDLHHTRRHGPLVDENGDSAWIIRCEWCGLSKREPLGRFAKTTRKAAKE